jgi:hypothetical protein
VSEVTEKVERALARVDRVMRSLDERDGPVRAAARRERQRINRDLGKRLARVGIAIGVVSLLAILVGLFMPLGMFGFLAAVGIAVGVAALLAFVPSRESRSAAPPALDLPNAEMVQRFDSFLFRSRAALPPAARGEVDSISRILPALQESLARLDALDPDAQDARRLMAKHLPGLLERYAQVPPAYRNAVDGEGISVEERLLEGLAAGRTALEGISDRLARQDVAALETHGRFLRSRYGEEAGSSLPPPAH